MTATPPCPGGRGADRGRRRAPKAPNGAGLTLLPVLFGLSVLPLLGMLPRLVTPGGPSPVAWRRTCGVTGDCPVWAPPLEDSTLVDSTVRVGWRDFTGYTTPGLCLAAVRGAETIAHTGAADSSGYYYNPEDTLATATVAIAQRCSSGFAVAAVPPTELLDLAQLALAGGDATKARAAAERYVAVAPNPVARRWALLAADTLFFYAKPRRWALVDTLTAQLDSLGAPAALQRKLAHDALHADAQARYDVPRLRREIPALMAACQQLSAADLQGGAAVCEQGALAFELFLVELYQSPGDVAQALAQAGQLVAPLGFKNWDGFRRWLLTLPGIRVALSKVGTVAPPLMAQHWVGPKGRVPGWPVKAKASVLLRGSLLSGELERMAVWKRLGEKYKDRLDITILVPTRGSFHDGPPLSPAEEAERVGRYYREQLGVPATIAIVETPVTQLPPPDGRFLRGEPPLAKDPYYGTNGFLLTDRGGKVLLADFLGGNASEAMLDAWIARAAGR